MKNQTVINTTKLIFFLLLYLILFLGGYSKYFFLSKSEKAHLETVLRQKRETLEQIKFSSRDLNLCRLQIEEPIIGDTVESLEVILDSGLLRSECVSIVDIP